MITSSLRNSPVLLVALIGPLVALHARADGMPSGPDFTQPGATQPKAAPAKPPKKGRDPLKVDRSIAVKDTPQKEIDLPGVLKVSGESLDIVDPSKAQKISWTNGGSQTVYLSVDEPNRIQLPFKNPFIVQTSDIKIERRASGNNIYVYWPSLPAKPRQIFIEPPGGGPALGLQLVPKEISAQTIIVLDDTGAVSGKKHTKSTGSDYITRIQDVMETVAHGRSPDGYSQVEINLPPIAMNGLVVTADARYSDRDGDLYVYTVRNPGQARATVREQEFDGPNVLAVSVFPKPVLVPGDKTKVFVLARKREGK
ncbi:type VI secretion protein [Pandoraea cepalis]|uniref:Type VI secretion protein n=1 Tax=Pandoraea cepalis TaxID=2508294 RepID=A0AAW7MGT2_9BURK|nr:type-F conjugative transfer system secretin TraK [Pandoraea cepalis]MDN4571866.1 type VI secretion protein [Pandoraea cepalis]MDN4581320.1 type VI secretion protein [Pandoraea cepalis]